MPGSAIEGKELVRNFIIKHDLKSFLDIGPGEGTYYDAFKGIGFYEGLPPINFNQIDGIEAWAPYINQYNLRDKYLNLWVGEAVHFNWDHLPQYDMVLLGDVIEHMHEGSGKYVIEQSAKHGKYVALSLPIYTYYQGWGSDGNWFEEHLMQYSHDNVMEILKDFEVLETFQGSIVGVYIFRKKSWTEA